MEGYDAKFKSQNAGWGRIASYYKPYWLLIPMGLVALINAVKMAPIAGCMLVLLWIYTQYPVFVEEDRESDFKKYTLFGLLAYVSICIIAGFFTAIERSMFGVMGERMITRLRLQLFTSILHK